MLFLLKRRYTTALAGLLLLAGLGLGLRLVVHDPPPVEFSVRTILLGVAVFVGVLVSDVLWHGVFVVGWGDRYRRRHRELVDVFRGQTWPALIVGAAMAGIGEELLFRGVSADPVYLSVGVVVFAALHHVRWSLWPFTVWAGYQGAVFAVVLHLTGVLGVTVVAHFLHDLVGFLIFRNLPARDVGKETSLVGTGVVTLPVPADETTR